MSCSPVTLAKKDSFQVSQLLGAFSSVEPASRLFQEINFQYREYNCCLTLRGTSDVSVSVSYDSKSKPEVIEQERIVGGFNRQICGKDWIPILAGGKGIATVTKKGETIGSQWELLPLIQKDNSGQLFLILQFRLNGAADRPPALTSPFKDARSLAKHLKEGIQSGRQDQSAKKFALGMVEEFREGIPTKGKIKEILELSTIPDGEIIEFLVRDFLHHIEIGDNKDALLQGLNLLFSNAITSSGEALVIPKINEVLEALFGLIVKSNEALVSMSQSLNKQTLKALIQIFETIRFLGGTVKRKEVVEESVRILEVMKKNGEIDDELKFLIDCALQAVLKLNDNSTEMKEFIKKSKVVFESVIKMTAGIALQDLGLLQEAVSNRKNYPVSLPMERVWFEDFLRVRALLTQDPPVDIVSQPDGYELGKNPNLTFATSLFLIDLVFDRSRIVDSRLRGVEYLYTIYSSDDFWKPTPFLKECLGHAFRILRSSDEVLIRRKVRQYQLPNDKGGASFQIEQRLLDEPDDNALFINTQRARQVDLEESSRLLAGQQTTALRQKMKDIVAKYPAAAKFCDFLPFMPKSFNEQEALRFISKDNLLSLENEGIIRLDDDSVLVSSGAELEDIFEQEQKVSILADALRYYNSFPVSEDVKENSGRAKVIASLSQHADSLKISLNDDQISHFLRAAEHLTEYTTHYSEAKIMSDLVAKKSLKQSPSHLFARGILGKLHRIEGRLDEAYNNMKGAYDGFVGIKDQSEYFYWTCLEFLKLLDERNEFGEQERELIAAVDGKLNGLPKLKAQFLIIQAAISIKKENFTSGTDFLDEADKVSNSGQLNKATSLVLRGEIACEISVPRAIKQFQAAHNILTRELGEKHPLTAENRFSVAIAHVLVGNASDFFSASDNYQEIFTAINSEHYKLGHLYLRKGEYAFALDKTKIPVDYDTAQYVLRRVLHRVRVEALLKLTKAYFYIKDYDKARVFCNEGITVASSQALINRHGVRGILGDCWVNMAAIEAKRGNALKADEARDEAKKYISDNKELEDKIIDQLKSETIEVIKKKGVRRYSLFNRKNQTTLVKPLPDFKKVRSSVSGHGRQDELEGPVSIGNKQVPDFLDDKQSGMYMPVYYRDLYKTYQALQKVYASAGGQNEKVEACQRDLEIIQKAHANVDTLVSASEDLKNEEVALLHIDAAVGWNRIKKLDKAEAEYRVAYALSKDSSLSWEEIVQIGLNLYEFYREKKKVEKSKEIFEDLINLRFYDYPDTSFAD